MNMHLTKEELKTLEEASKILDRIARNFQEKYFCMNDDGACNTWDDMDDASYICKKYSRCADVYFTDEIDEDCYK